MTISNIKLKIRLVLDSDLEKIERIWTDGVGHLNPEINISETVIVLFRKNLK